MSRDSNLSAKHQDFAAPLGIARRVSCYSDVANVSPPQNTFCSSYRWLHRTFQFSPSSSRKKALPVFNELQTYNSQICFQSAHHRKHVLDTIVVGEQESCLLLRHLENRDIPSVKPSRSAHCTLVKEPLSPAGSKCQK